MIPRNASGDTATGRRLADVARTEAARSFHGRVMRTEANLAPIL